MPDANEIADTTALRETARKLLRANEVNPDPNTSMVVATTAVLGLCARRVTGKGQKIFVDMFGANAYAHWDDFLSYDGKSERPRVDTNGFGLGPLYRLYECKMNCVFLGVVTATERAKLAAVTGLDLSHANLEEKLAKFFKSKSVIEWEHELCSIGIGCVQADAYAPPEFFMKDQHVRGEELLVPAVHPEWGDYFRLGPMVEFERDLTYPGTGAAGGATESLLLELGYESSAIDSLLDAGKVRAA